MPTNNPPHLELVEVPPETAKPPHVPEEPPPPRPPRMLFSIRFIVTVVATVLTALAVLGVGMVAERKGRRALTAEIETRLLLEAENLARTSVSVLLADFPELTLHPLAKDLKNRRPELELVVITDHNGIIQGHAESRHLGAPFEPPPGLSPLEPERELGPDERLEANRDLLMASVPIHHGKRVIGSVSVALRRNHVEQLIEEARSEGVLILGGVLAVGVMVTLLVMTLLLRPIGALREGLERIGQGDLDTPIRLRDRTELGLLAETVNQMAIQLKLAQLEKLEKERLSHELELAREIQRSLLPTHQLRVGDFLVSGTQRVAAEVGGDYYDFFPLPDRKVGVAVADVAGKGLGGCMVMSMLSALLRGLRESYTSPSKLLVELDRRLGDTLRPGTFITIFYAVLDPETGTLTYASAGHSPLLVYRGATEEIDRLKSTGIPVGARRDGSIAGTLQDTVITIEQGDLVVQHTDGISEAFDESGDSQFGLERLEDIVKRKAAAGCAAILEAVREEVDSWRGPMPRHDDETLLVIGCETEAPEEEERAGRGPEALALLEKPLEHLSDARIKGEFLYLPARLDRLGELREWLGTRARFQELPAVEFELLSTALYEVCANIIEHGYGNDPRAQIDLWWVPSEEVEDEGPAPCRGHFLILDQGRPFSADNWKETDFTDPAVWRRGRGFGLDIIHRAMVRVAYGPSTPEGNLTMLVFDPAELQPMEKKYA